MSHFCSPLPPDSYGNIAPALEPAWALAVAGSSYIMWEKSTENVGYFLAQVKSAKQWVSAGKRRARAPGDESPPAPHAVLPRRQRLLRTGSSSSGQVFCPGFGGKFLLIWSQMVCASGSAGFSREGGTRGGAVHQPHAVSCSLSHTGRQPPRWCLGNTPYPGGASNRSSPRVAPCRDRYAAFGVHSLVT